VYVFVNKFKIYNKKNFFFKKYAIFFINILGFGRFEIIRKIDFIICPFCRRIRLTAKTLDFLIANGIIEGFYLKKIIA